MFNLHFHRAETVPFYTDNVHSLYRCIKCNKILIINRNTGFKHWQTKEKAFNLIFPKSKAE